MSFSKIIPLNYSGQATAGTIVEGVQRMQKIIDTDAGKTISNWSGDINFTPGKVRVPANEEELQQIISDSRAYKKTIRCVGSLHSCSGIFQTNDTIVSMENFKGMISVDPGTRTAEVAAGATVEEIGEELHSVGLAMENTGHINKQTISGTISTGTHGAGKKLKNLSGQVSGMRLITGTGEILETDDQRHGDLMKALRVSLGSIGIITA